MRKFYTKSASFLIFLTFALANFNIALAQQLPNAGFEAWNSSWNGEPQPDNWSLSNVEQVGLKFNIGERTTDAHSGSFAVKCQDTEVGALGITAVSPSWITLGTPWAYLEGLSTNSATAGTTGGINWTFRPDTLAVWVKRTTNNFNEDMNLVYYSWRGQAVNDSYGNKGGGCTTTTRYDEESDICKSDFNECKTPSGNAVQVAEGWLRTRTNYPNWTLVKVPIKYFNNDVPEKLNVILSASNYPHKRANDGLYTSSILIADDVTMIYSSEIYEMYVNGRKFSDFNSKINEYTYELGEFETEMPDISSCKRSGRQLSGSEISIEKGVLNEKPTIITVKAEDGSSTTVYKVNFISYRDVNPYPETIKVNGVAISDFSKKRLNYDIVLPYGTTETPVVEIKKGHPAQTYTIDPFSVPGSTKITVFAENKEYSVTYTLNFTIDKLKDTTLKDIQTNGVSISDFMPTKVIYTVDVPVGTVESPLITYTSAYPEGAQTVVVDRKPLNEVSTVTVSVPEVATPRVYRISYNVTESKYSMLQDLKVDGVTIVGFSPEVMSYTYELPLGTTEIPEISWTQGDAYQTVSLEECEVPGTAKVTVVAQNGKNSSIYRIKFIIEQSSNSQLKDLKVDGNTIEGFSPETTNYTYNLPAGTSVMPSVTWEQGDEYQTVRVVKGGVRGDTQLYVTAQNGNQTKYTITFNTPVSTNSYLSNLLVDGSSISGFAPDTFDYEYDLKPGVSVIPSIKCVKGDDYQSVVISKGAVDEYTTIDVTAESGDVSTYSILFKGSKSENAKLKNILLDGEAIPDFDPDNFSYNVLLAEGEQYPVVTVEKEDAQSVSISEPDALGSVHIGVTPEEGNSAIYYVNFYRECESDCNLSMIYINGEPIPGFKSDILDYSVEIERGARFPDIEVKKADPKAVVNEIIPAQYGEAEFNVTAANGVSTKRYSVNVEYKKNYDATLRNITVNSAEIGFSPDILSYTVDVHNGEYPVIGFEAQNEWQIVTVTTKEEGAEINVIAADGGSSSKYTIAYNVVLSDNALLSDLQIYDEAQHRFVSIDGFSPETFEYAIALYKDESDVYTLNCIGAAKNQQYVIRYAGIGEETIVEVTSEDGVTKAAYKVAFDYEKSSECRLMSIAVGNDEVPGFDPDVYSYDVIISDGTLTRGNISVTKFDNSSVVSVSDSAFMKQSIIKVTAENGDEKKYVLNFRHESKENVLKAIYINGVEIEGFQPDVFSYNVEVPEGETPEVMFDKGFNSQSVLTAQSDNAKSVLTVKANREGAADVQYTINYTLKQKYNRLSSIKIDGTQIEGFDASKTKYVVLVNDRPSAITAEASDGTQVAASVDEISHIQFITPEKGGLRGVTYDVYLHYTGDVIPNSDFASWEKTTYQVETLTHKGPWYKPSGWKSAADVVSKAFAWTTVCGPEISKAGDGAVNFTTTYWAAIASAVPSVITLGDLDVSLAVAGKSSVSFSGNGVTFRNTPDVAVINSKQNKKAGDGLKIYYWFKDGDSKHEFVYNETAESSAYSEKRLDLATNGLNNIQNLNIAINATGQGSSFNSGADVYVKSLGFSYSSAIAAIKVNGVDVSMNGTSGTVAIPSECVGNPVLDITGEVDDQMYSVDYGTEKAGVRKIMITSYAEDISSTVYNITVSRALSTLNDLKSITIDGTSLPGFDPAVTSYTYTIAAGSHYMPCVTAMGVSCHQTIEFAAEADKLTINSTSESGEKKIYTVTFVEEQASNADLTAISVEGQEISFAPEVTEYNVTLAPRTRVMPAVSYSKISDNQSVEFVEGGVNGKTTLLVTSADGSTTKQYVVNFSVAPKDDTTSKLASMQVVDATSQILFDPDVKSYLFDKMVDDTVAVMFTRAFAEDSMVVCQNNDSIVWSLHNRVSATEDSYKLKFTNTISSNAFLKGINHCGAPVEGFDKEVKDYIVAVAANECMLVEPVTFEPSQLVESVYSSEDSTYSFKVFSASERDDINLYSVKLAGVKSNNTTLKTIVVGGSALAGFSPDVREYNITLTAGSLTLPSVCVEAAEQGQKITSVPGERYEINVLAEDGENEGKYILNFNVAKEAVDLDMIYIDGKELPSFNAWTHSYSVELPLGQSELPDVTFSKAFEMQSVSKSVDDDTVTLTVAASGYESAIYTIRFVRNLSTNANLKMIDINGEHLKKGADNFSVDYDFSETQYEYNVELKLGSDLSKVEISTDNGDQWQKVDIVKESESLFVIYVTAQVQEYTSIYTINISVKKSDNTKLKSLFSDGKLIDGFDPDKVDYEIVLDDETDVVKVPVISWEAGDEYQKIDTVCSADKKIQSVRVEAGNGATRVYAVRYISQYAKLKSITLGDERILIPDFDTDIYEYHVNLPFGTTTLPQIAFEKGETGQSVETDFTEDVNGKSFITVTSEDGGHKHIYEIAFSVAKSDVATLDMITYNGNNVKDFSPEVFEYKVNLPQETAIRPDVRYELTQPGVEEASLSYVETTNGWEYSIEVKAQSGKNTNIYKVTFVVPEENRLKDLKLFGKTLKDFDKDKMSYKCILPPYSLLPTVNDVTYTLMSDKSQAVVTQESEDLISIKVTSSDGCYSYYSIDCDVELSDNTDLAGIYINGKILDGFSSDILEYTYKLPFGSVSVDTSKYVITYMAEEPYGQKIETSFDEDPKKMIYYIDVTAQNGDVDTYIIYFVSDAFDPSIEPTATEVCVTSTADGGWKFVTKCNNVMVVLSDTNGRFLATSTLPVVDVNIGEICDPAAEGFTYYAPQDQIVIYNFLYTQKKNILSGKFKGQRQ